MSRNGQAFWPAPFLHRTVLTTADHMDDLNIGAVGDRSGSEMIPGDRRIIDPDSEQREDVSLLVDNVPYGHSFLPFHGLPVNGDHHLSPSTGPPVLRVFLRLRQLRVCPSRAIDFLAEEKKIKIRIDRCIFCSQCNDICPVNCLSMSGDFLLANEDRFDSEMIVK